MSFTITLKRKFPVVIAFSLIGFVVIITQMPLAPHLTASSDLESRSKVPAWPRTSSRDITLYVRPDVTTVIIPATQVCASSLKLIVVVCSAVKNVKTRMAIRETWGSSKYVGESARVVFFLGASQGKSVQEESDRFRDVVQEDFVDTYNNLTIKSVMMLKWIEKFCKDVQFVMKTDDDTFVNVKSLLKILDSEPAELFGFLFKYSEPIRDKYHKWNTPMYMYSDPLFPDYLSGVGYVMSRDVVSRLYAVALNTPLLHLEDVFLTGLCARRAGIVPKSQKGLFYNKKDFVPCRRLSEVIVTSHHQTEDDLRRVWCMIEKSCTSVTQDHLTIKQRLIRFFLCLLDMAGVEPF